MVAAAVAVRAIFPIACCASAFDRSPIFFVPSSQPLWIAAARYPRAKAPVVTHRLECVRYAEPSATGACRAAPCQGDA